jgi:hypothetical protein
MVHQSLYVIITELKLDFIHGVLNVFYFCCSYDWGRFSNG